MKPSCIKTLITTIALCVTAFAYANNMQSSFNEAMNLGKAQNGQAKETITHFNPKSVSDNFTSNPDEVNLKGNASGLGNLGLSELNSSEVGKAINTSTVNNPKVAISPDADFLKTSENIRQNARVISGIKSGKQCVKQVLSKSNFTQHYCEKDQQVTKTCKITSNVKWKGGIVKKKTTKSIKLYANKELTADFKSPVAFPNVFKDLGRWSVIINYEYIAPEDLTITGADFYFKNNKGWYGFNRVYVRFFSELHQSSFNDYKSHIISEKGLSIKVKKGDRLNVQLANVPYSLKFFHKNYFFSGIENYITYYYDVEEEINTLEPEIYQVSSCDIDTENNIELSAQCTQKGGARAFFKDGKSYSVNADCWETTLTYSVSEASDNECKAYEKNPNCSVAERECILDLEGNCTRFRNKYQCSTSTKTEGYLCGDEFFCSDGSCSDLEGGINNELGHVVSQLANLAKAGEDFNYDEQELTAFSGKPLFCRKSGFGYSDCCKDSGWGQDIGLAKCNSEEQMLGQAKEKKTAVFVGTFCSKRILGKCVRRKSSYCVFDNKLARITQVQGRSGQLGIGFGGAKNPDCRGLSVEELQRIDFNNMDYSNFYEELNSNIQLPDKQQLMDYMKKSVTEQMQRQ